MTKINFIRPATVAVLLAFAASGAMAKGHFLAGGGAAEAGQGTGEGKIIADSVSKGGNGRVGGTVKDGIDLERANTDNRGVGQTVFNPR